MDRALNILKSVYGYSQFRLNQADVIQTLLNGGDVMTLMPTGGGKSLCYQIPALIREGTGIVISPLIALMQDQVTALRQLGVRASFMNSTLSTAEIRKTQQQLLSGELDLLYIAPERLLATQTLELLKDSQLALFAIDEAHCVSQWGHDFRKEYQQLSILHEQFPEVPRIALTATADKRTRQEIIQQLALQNARCYVSSFNRPNIQYSISDGQQSREQLWKFINHEHPDDAGIVYCLSRKKVESVAEWLTKKGRIALPYHAGLSANERQQNQNRFLREEGVIIVATIAFGMGIDKPDVRFVAHLNLPKSIEAYYQETGRAGRDGEPANAWMGYSLQDVILLKQMIQDGDGDDHYKRISYQKLDAVIGLGELVTCRRQTLLNYFGETLEEPCGNCDNCINPPETWDATIAAQKAMSCVYRVGQRFGVNYVIDVLSGKDDQRIRQYQHDKLSTFGIGKELNDKEWRTVFRQLVIQGYLLADANNYNIIKLTEKAWPVLRNEEKIFLRKLRKQDRNKSKKVSGSAAALGSDNLPLYEILKALRLQLSRKQNIPAFHIFHDSTLVQMSLEQPLTLKAMGDLHGVGSKKLEKYGQLFVDKINEFNSSQVVSSSS